MGKRIRYTEEFKLGAVAALWQTIPKTKAYNMTGPPS